MPTYIANFTQTVTKQGTLEIEADTFVGAVNQARELMEIGDQNEEIGWDADEDWDCDTSFESVDLDPKG